MIAAATWLYFQCVDFTIHLATLSDTTYRDSNSFLFFVLWPAVSLLLVLWVYWNQRQLHRASSRRQSTQ